MTAHLETIDVQDEHRWNAGASLTLGVAILILLYPILLSFAALDYPTDGWTIRTESTTIAGGPWKIGTNISDQVSTLRPDDSVLAINGQPLVPYMLPPLPTNLREGQVLQLTVQRGGETLQAFAATVRNETDLDALTAELLRVIQETTQPATLSIWLRDPADQGLSGDQFQFKKSVGTKEQTG
ncbi:MAG: hypothetical protein R6X18_02145 [Chloroflexota bacterium]